MMVRRNLILALAALALTYAGCGGSDEGTGGETLAAEEPQAGELPEPIGAEGADTVAIDERLVDEFEVSDDPDWMVSAYGSLWVKRDNGTVNRIDPQTGRTTAEIPPGAGGKLCQGLGSGGGAIYSCPGEGSIDVIDPATNEVASTLKVDKLPEQGRLVYTADALWVLTDAGQRLEALSRSDGEAATEIDLGGSCSELAGDETTVWVTCPFEDRVIRVDAKAGEITGELELAGPRPASVANELWVGSDDGVAQVDPKTLEVTALYEVFPGSFGAVLATPDAVWVRTDGGPFLTRIDPQAQTVAEIIEAPKLKDSGDVVLAGDSLWATSYNDNLLLQLEPSP